MNAERLHNQARADRRVRWAATDVELAVEVNRWQAEQLDAGADPQILAEVVRLIASNLDYVPMSRDPFNRTKTKGLPS